MDLEQALASLVVLVASSLFGYIILRRHMDDPRTISLVGLTVTATFVVTTVRYQLAISETGQDGLTSDTFRYLLYGRSSWLNDVPASEALTSGEGTLGTIGLSQVAFTLLGDNWFAIFLSGSLAGLVGSWCMISALLIIRPDTSPYLLYALALFPSVLYWSSSFGKEAFSQLAMGIAYLALARQWSTRSISVPRIPVSLAAAVALAWIVRPQVALLLLVAATLAWLVIEQGAPPRLRAGVLVMAAVLMPVALVVVTSAGLSDPLGIINDLSSRHERTSLGGSQIGAGRPEGVLGLLLGIPTAIFRPLPWEAGLAGLGSSLDTFLILFVAIRAWRSRPTVGGLDTGSARMIVFATVSIMVLFGPLAGYGNLGLLARMRSLIVPSLLVLLALLPKHGHGTRKTILREDEERVR